MSCVLHVNNLTIKTISGITLVDDITFNLCRGELVVLLGQSGSGKTMTSMAIQALLPLGVEQTGGNIEVDGKELSSRVRGNDIAMIMQAPASCFDPVFNIKTQMIDIFKSHDKQELCNDEKLESLINSVGLDNAASILKAYPFQLSGGMLQRIMIAITLALDVPIIIADEPTSDLDLPAQAEIIDMFLQLDRKEKAFMVITHDISVAKRMADRVLVMREGKIVDNFLIGDINNGDRHPYTKLLVSANNSLANNKWGL